MNVYQAQLFYNIRTLVYCVVFNTDAIGNLQSNNHPLNPVLDSNNNFRMEGLQQGRNLVGFDPEFFRLYKDYDFAQNVSLEFEQINSIDGNFSGSHVTKQSLASVNIKLEKYNLEMK